MPYSPVMKWPQRLQSMLAAVLCGGVFAATPWVGGVYAAQAASSAHIEALGSGATPIEQRGFVWLPWGYYTSLGQCEATGAGLVATEPTIVNYRCDYVTSGPNTGLYHLYVREYI